MCTHGSMNVHAEVKGEPQACPYLDLYLVFEERSFTELKAGFLHHPLASFIPTLGLQASHNHTRLLHRCCGSELRSFCLYSKCSYPSHQAMLTRIHNCYNLSCFLAKCIYYQLRPFQKDQGNSVKCNLYFRDLTPILKHKFSIAPDVERLKLKVVLILSQ